MGGTSREMSSGCTGHLGSGQVTGDKSERLSAAFSSTCHRKGRRDNRGMTRRGLGFQIYKSVSDRINTLRPKMAYIFLVSDAN